LPLSKLMTTQIQKVLTSFAYPLQSPIIKAPVFDFIKGSQKPNADRLEGARLSKNFPLKQLTEKLGVLGFLHNSMPVRKNEDLKYKLITKILASVKDTSFGGNSMQVSRTGFQENEEREESMSAILEQANETLNQLIESSSAEIKLLNQMKRMKHGRPAHVTVEMAIQRILTELATVHSKLEQFNGILHVPVHLQPATTDVIKKAEIDALTRVLKQLTEEYKAQLVAQNKVMSDSQRDFMRSLDSYLLGFNSNLEQLMEAYRVQTNKSVNENIASNMALQSSNEAFKREVVNQLEQMAQNISTLNVQAVAPLQTGVHVPTVSTDTSNPALLQISTLLNDMQKTNNTNFIEMMERLQQIEHSLSVSGQTSNEGFQTIRRAIGVMTQQLEQKVKENNKLVTDLASRGQEETVTQFDAQLHAVTQLINELNLDIESKIRMRFDMFTNRNVDFWKSVVLSLGDTKDIFENFAFIQSRLDFISRMGDVNQRATLENFAQLLSVNQSVIDNLVASGGNNRQPDFIPLEAQPAQYVRGTGGANGSGETVRGVGSNSILRIEPVKPDHVVNSQRRDAVNNAPLAIAPNSVNRDHIQAIPAVEPPAVVPAPLPAIAQIEAREEDRNNLRLEMEQQYNHLTTSYRENNFFREGFTNATDKIYFCMHFLGAQNFGNPIVEAVQSFIHDTRRLQSIDREYSPAPAPAADPVNDNQDRQNSPEPQVQNGDFNLGTRRDRKISDFYELFNTNNDYMEQIWTALAKRDAQMKKLSVVNVPKFKEENRKIWRTTPVLTTKEEWKPYYDNIAPYLNTENGKMAFKPQATTSESGMQQKHKQFLMILKMQFLANRARGRPRNSESPQGGHGISNRLLVLLGEIDAGNDSEKVKSEAVSILEQMKKQGTISEEKYNDYLDILS